jgi:hypothetical protein
VGKQERNQRAGGVAQVVGHPPSKCEALKSNPNTGKREKEREREREREK